MRSFLAVLLIAVLLPRELFAKGTKYGCLTDSNPTVTIYLCSGDERAQIITASFGSWVQTFRHVCSHYPAEPSSGWPVCSNNSVETVTAKIVERCNYHESCSFDYQLLFPRSTLNCNTGDFMYFQVQFECFSPKSVCASFVSKDSLVFNGVQKGQISYHNCPDYWVHGNRAQQKCFGNDVWDPFGATSCPNTLINEAVFLLTQSAAVPPTADTLGETWTKLLAGFINESSVLPVLHTVGSLIQTSVVNIDYQRLSMVMTVARVGFISSGGSASTYIPLSSLPRLTFRPGLLTKPDPCTDLSSLTAIVGTVDFSGYTDSFVVENLNSEIIFATLHGANCAVTEENLNQPIELDVLLTEDTPDGYIPECITWGHTVTSRYKEATADFPNACSTVEVSKAIAKCSCNNTGGFFAVRTVAQPIPSTPKPGNASARTDTTELTTSDSDKTDTDENSMDIDDADSDSSSDTDDTSSDSDAFDDADDDFALDIQWILFSTSCCFYVPMLYLVPLFAILKSIFWIVRLLCRKCKLGLFKSSSPGSAATQDAASSNGDNNQDSIRLVNSNGVVVSDQSDRPNYRLLFVVYSPLAAFCMATSSAILFACSSYHDTTSVKAKYQFTVETFFLALSAFLLLQGSLFEFTFPNHPVILVFIAIVPAVGFSIGAHLVTDLDSTICWPLPTSLAIAIFAIPVIIFLIVLLVILLLVSRKNPDNRIRIQILGVWMSSFALLLCTPVTLFFLTAYWTVTAATAFLLVGMICPVTAIGLFLRIVFSELHKYPVKDRIARKEVVLSPLTSSKDTQPSASRKDELDPVPADKTPPVKSLQSHDINANETET